MLIPQFDFSDALVLKGGEENQCQSFLQDTKASLDCHAWCAVFICVVLEESWSDPSLHEGSWEKGMDLVSPVGLRLWSRGGLENDGIQ